VSKNFIGSDLRGQRLSGDLTHSDFSYANLQGVDLSHTVLTGSNFSHADLRGTHFAYAKLEQCCFADAQFGLTPWKRYTATAVIILTAIGIAIIACIGGGFAENPTHFPEQYRLWMHISSFGSLAIMMMMLLTRRFKQTATLFLLMFFSCGTIGWLCSKIDPTPISYTLVAIAWVAAGAGFNIILSAVCCIFISVLLGRRFYALIPLIQMGGISALLYGISHWHAFAPYRLHYPLAIIAATSPFAAYLGYLTKERRSPNYAIIFEVAISLMTRGTRFHKAILDHATFSNFNSDLFHNGHIERQKLSQTDLLLCNFNGASIKQVCWYGCTNHHLANFKDTYMEQDAIRNLATLDNHSNTHYDHSRHLSDLYLRGIDLSGFSFIDANLDSADLAMANLSNTYLVGAKLAHANLSGANLSGACIENWMITEHTNLSHVSCDFIYENCRIERSTNGTIQSKTLFNRLPQAKTAIFSTTGFHDYVKKAIMSNALKFYYHDSGYSPEAHAQSFAALKEQYADHHFEVTSLTRLSASEIIIEVQSNLPMNDATKAAVNEKYFTHYQQLLEQFRSYISADTTQAIENAMASRIEFNHGIMDAIRSILIFIITNVYKSTDDVATDIGIDRSSLMNFLSRKTSHLQASTRKKYIKETPVLCQQVYKTTGCSQLEDFKSLNKTDIRNHIVAIGASLFQQGYKVLS